MTDEISAARDDVLRTRAQMADTVAQIEGRITGRMDAVKAKLDVVQMIKDNPWTAIAVATGIGAAISASGADAKAARAAAESAQQAAALAAAKAKQAGSATVEAMKAAPGHASSAAGAAKSGIVGHLDTLVASMVAGVIERLKSSNERA